MKRTTRSVAVETMTLDYIAGGFPAALGWTIVALGAFALLHNLAQLL